MKRLDKNRGLIQLALKSNSKATDLQKLCIWGNYSPTIYTYERNVSIKGKSALSWIDTD